MNLELRASSADGDKTSSEKNIVLRLEHVGLWRLNKYFSRYPNSDVAIILEGAINFTYMLKNHLNRNLLLFTPESSYKLKRRQMRMSGEPDNSHPLLLFDSDMLSGDTMRQARDYFERQGYTRDRMFSYLHLGLAFKANCPQLKQIDDMLDYREKNWPSEFPKIVKPVPN